MDQELMTAPGRGVDVTTAADAEMLGRDVINRFFKK